MSGLIVVAIFLILLSFLVGVTRDDSSKKEELKGGVEITREQLLKAYTKAEMAQYLYPYVSHDELLCRELGL